MRNIAHVFTRAVADGGHETVTYELPSWAILIFLLDLIIILPVTLYVSYTLEAIYPSFAIVEDENPPAYEPVSLNEGGEDNHTSRSNPTDGHPRTVTSSLRSINRLLYANGGIKANFRGLFFYLVQVFFARILISIFSFTLGGYFSPIATLLAVLALAQFNTAWVHIVISAPTTKSHFSRLPSFKRTFDATWKAIVLNWAALELLRWLPSAMQWALDYKLPSVEAGENTHVVNWGESGDAWKVALIAVVTLIANFTLVVPTHVILVRIQASLLPGEDDPIIPFDRSFEGTIEPLVVGGKGYATIAQAWQTFSKAAWRRVITLYVKIFLVHMVYLVAVVALLVSETLLIQKKIVKHVDA